MAIQGDSYGRADKPIPVAYIRELHVERQPIEDILPDPSKTVVYGFKIAKNNSDPETRVTYTDDAVGMAPARVNLTTGIFDYGSWRNAWFIQGNVPVMLNYDGTEAYELDPLDYTKKLNGTPSDVSNVNFAGNAMAKFPLVWFKRWEDDNYEYVQISNKQVDSDFKAYAHQRADGSIMTATYISCFDGALQGTTLRSIKGLSLLTGATGTQEIGYATANNPDGAAIWYTRTWSQRMMVNDLLTLISKSDDSQSAFGMGHNTGDTASTGIQQRTCGALSNKGQFYGTSGNEFMKVFHVENWWGHSEERIAGLISNNGRYLVKMTQPYNTTGEGYADVGMVPNCDTSTYVAYGYISASNRSEYGRLPTAVAAASNTYQCDGMWSNNSQVNYALVSISSVCDGIDIGIYTIGASALDVGAPVSYAAWDIGAALSCQQPAP